MTAVTIRPTFSKDTRPSNGLEDIADELIADKTEVHYVVGVVKWAGGSVDVDGAITPAVKFLGIEPLAGDAADQAKKILDGARKARGLGHVEDLIVKTDPTLFDFDGPDEPAGELEGQTEIRLGPDGPREVPPPSGEEAVAELAERRAAKSARKPAADPFNADGGQA